MKKMKKKNSEIHPFSIRKYFMSGKWRYTIIAVIILLGVFLLYLLSLVIQSTQFAFQRTLIEPMKYYSIMTGREGYINDIIINDVKESGFIDHTMYLEEYFIPMHLNVGGTIYTSAFILKNEDMINLMKKMNLKLEDGRLPIEGKSEILLHKNVAQNIGIQIGERVGKNADQNIWFSEEYTVVGLLDGLPFISFAPQNVDHTPKCSVLVIPKENNMEGLNNLLKNNMSYSIAVRNLETEHKTVHEILDSINQFIISISLMVVVIISSSIGFLYYIFYIQRRSEFIVLWVLGYTRQEVIGHTFLEIATINVLGYMAGIILSILAGLVMDRSLFSTIGQPLHLLNLNSLLISTCVPVLSTFFGIFPVWRMLKRNISDYCFVMN